MSDNVESIKKTPLKRRQKLAMALLGLVILSSGFVLGASATFFVLRDRLRPLPPPFPSGRMLERLTKDLALTDDQRAALKLLLDDQHSKFSEMRKIAGEKMTEHRNEMVASMKRILTEEQFTKWDNDFKSRMKRRGGWDRHRREGGRGPGSGRGRPEPRQHRDSGGHTQPNREQDPNQTGNNC